jgi:hypothetical protein
MKIYRIRYKATLRGIVEVSAKTASEAREKAEAEGYDPRTAEQTDFEILGVREVD